METRLNGNDIANDIDIMIIIVMIMIIILTNTFVLKFQIGCPAMSGPMNCSTTFCSNFSFDQGSLKVLNNIIHIRSRIKHDQRFQIL